MDSFLDAVSTRAADAVSSSRGADIGSGSWTTRAMALAMASHPRLGAYSEPSVRQVAASRDLLLAIFRHVTLTVPDDAPTLHCALRKALPWQRILLRCGEYLVSSLDNDHPGSSVLRLRSPVHIVGEPGTIIRGTLIFEASCAGGSLSDLRIDDGPSRHSPKPHGLPVPSTFAFLPVCFFFQADHGIRNPDRSRQNLCEPRVSKGHQNPKPKIRNPESRPQPPEPMALAPDERPRDIRTQNPESGIRNPDPSPLLAVL